MLLPALNKAREKARVSSCINSLKQVGSGFALYAADYDGYIPFESSQWWQYACRYYLKDGGKYHTLGLLISEGYIREPKTVKCGDPSPDYTRQTFLTMTSAVYSGYTMRPVWGYPTWQPYTKKRYRLQDGDSSVGLAADNITRVNYSTQYPNGKYRTDASGNKYCAWHENTYNLLFFDGHVTSLPWNRDMLTSGTTASSYDSPPSAFWTYVKAQFGEKD